MKKALFSTILVLVVLSIATTLAVLYAQGYRLIPRDGKTIVEGTGLLVLTSKPDGARVYINNELSTATDQTINLEPGNYEVKIEKDGYFAWKKKITIKEGEVSQAYALLFPVTPRLEPITSTGANNVVTDSTGSMIAYTVTGNLPAKNGVYLIDMNNRPILPIGSVITQLTNDVNSVLSSSLLSFSPDGNDLIATVSGSVSNSSYLLKTNGFNQTPANITSLLVSTQREWEKLSNAQLTQTINSLPRALRKTATDYFKDPVLSPEEDKILYTASASALLNPILKSPLKGVNSTPETRSLVAGNTYVYDIKEDRNYLLYDSTASVEPAPKFTWHPDSAHLVFAKDDKVQVVEFDNQNLTTLYAGPFLNNFLAIWPDGSNLVILTNLNAPTLPPNLYRISLR